MYPNITTNHTAKMQDLLLQQFRDKPNILSLIKVYGDRIQEVELEYFTLLDSLGISTATGFALDLIGKEVAEPRNSRNDDAYRQGILVKIFINNASGTPEDVISATKQITTANIVKYTEQYPAGVALEVIGADFISHAPTIKRTLPAGVDLIFSSDLGVDLSTSYGAGAFTQIVTFESNHQYLDLVEGGRMQSEGTLTTNTRLRNP